MYKNIQKKIYIQILIFNVMLLFCVYSIAVFSIHYSPDSFSTFFNNPAHQHLRLGRLLNFLIYSGFETLNINIAKHVIFNQLFLIITMALLMTKLTEMFQSALNLKECRKDIFILNLIISLFFININILEGWFLFPETCFSGSISLTLSILSICLFCEAKNLKGYLLSFFVLLLALNMYQVYIENYLIIGAAFVFIENKTQIDFKCVRRLIYLIIIGAIASLTSVLILKVLEEIGLSTGNDRAVVLSLQVLINNAQSIFKNAIQVLNDYNGYLPKYSVATFVIALYGVIIFGIRKNGISPLAHYIAIVIFSCAIMIAAYLPHFVVSTVWLAPRAILGVSAAIASLAILAFSFSETFGKKVLFLAVIAYLTVNYIQVQRIVVNGSINDGIDQEQVHQIGQVIEEYQNDTGNTIKYFAIHNDGGYKWAYDSVNYNIYETNSRKANVEWAVMPMINYYLGSDYLRVDFPDEKYLDFFGDKNWDYFEPDEQIICEGDTLYMAVY